MMDINFQHTGKFLPDVDGGTLTAKQQQVEEIRWAEVSDHLPLVMTLKLLEQ